MIRSMTGYGKARTSLDGVTYTVEIRSVNGKTADVSLKTSLLPREKEPQVKQELAQLLQRGNIEVFATAEYEAQAMENSFNETFLQHGFEELTALFHGMEATVSASDILSALLRMPEAREVRKKEMPPAQWEALHTCLCEAAHALDCFRCQEGARLGEDLLGRVTLIEAHLTQAVAYDHERIELVRTRLNERLEALDPPVNVDANRLEQELIYYLEKADITEEQVRLRQHCAYFRQTLENEPHAGRKLGFIAQEMGREINTLGSKAAHAQMQQWVVRMKDELEKIKEQVLNVL